MLRWNFFKKLIELRAGYDVQLLLDVDLVTFIRNPKLHPVYCFYTVDLQTEYYPTHVEHQYYPWYHVNLDMLG